MNKEITIKIPKGNIRNKNELKKVLYSFTKKMSSSLKGVVFTDITSDAKMSLDSFTESHAGLVTKSIIEYMIKNENIDKNNCTVVVKKNSISLDIVNDIDNENISERVISGIDSNMASKIFDRILGRL